MQNHIKQIHKYKSIAIHYFVLCLASFRFNVFCNIRSPKHHFSQQTGSSIGGRVMQATVDADEVPKGICRMKLAKSFHHDNNRTLGLNWICYDLFTGACVAYSRPSLDTQSPNTWLIELKPLVFPASCASFLAKQLNFSMLPLVLAMVARAAKVCGSAVVHLYVFTSWFLWIEISTERSTHGKSGVLGGQEKHAQNRFLMVSRMTLTLCVSSFCPSTKTAPAVHAKVQFVSRPHRVHQITRQHYLSNMS